MGTRYDDSEWKGCSFPRIRRYECAGRRITEGECGLTHGLRGDPGAGFLVANLVHVVAGPTDLLRGRDGLLKYPVALASQGHTFIGHVLIVGEGGEKWLLPNVETPPRQPGFRSLRRNP